MSTATAGKTRKQLAEEARDLIAAAKAIQEKGDDATPEEMETAASHFDAAKAISDRLATSAKGIVSAEALTSVLADLKAERNPPALPTGDARKAPNADALKSIFGPDFDAGDDGASLYPVRDLVGLAGRKFVSDPVIRDYFKSIAPNGHFSQNTRIQTPKSFLDTRELQAQLGGDALKTLIYTGSSSAGGALVFSTQRPDIVSPVPGFGRLGVADLVTRIPVASDAVEWIRMTGVTNNAAIVAEATATSGSSGTKPESAMAFERVTTTIEVVAHWIPVTTRILSDARQLRGYIDAFLRRGLERALAVQILQGDGTGDNFTGVINQSGVLTQAYTTDLLITTRKAITNIQVNWQVGDPTAYVFHPTDWETIELSQDAEERFYFGGPMTRVTPRLWGMPVVTSLAMPLGTSVLADWAEAMLFDREQTMISASNSHSDFFVRNLVAVLAELRAGFGVRSPKAFCVIDLTA